jgi:hypothetical protein
MSPSGLITSAKEGNVLRRERYIPFQEYIDEKTEGFLTKAHQEFIANSQGKSLESLKNNPEGIKLNELRLTMKKIKVSLLDIRYISEEISDIEIEQPIEFDIKEENESSLVQLYKNYINSCMGSNGDGKNTDKEVINACLELVKNKLVFYMDLAETAIENGVDERGLKKIEEIQQDVEQFCQLWESHLGDDNEIIGNSAENLSAELIKTKAFRQYDINATRATSIKLFHAYHLNVMVNKLDMRKNLTDILKDFDKDINNFYNNRKDVKIPDNQTLTAVQHSLIFKKSNEYNREVKKDKEIDSLRKLYEEIEQDFDRANVSSYKNHILYNISVKLTGFDKRFHELFPTFINLLKKDINENAKMNKNDFNQIIMGRSEALMKILMPGETFSDRFIKMVTEKLKDPALYDRYKNMKHKRDIAFLDVLEQWFKGLWDACCGTHHSRAVATKEFNTQLVKITESAYDETRRPKKMKPR